MFVVQHNLRIAAVVNEYGSVDHDGGVLERDGLTDSVDKLMGGCVCCQTSLGGELEEKVGELLRRPDHAEDRYDRSVSLGLSRLRLCVLSVIASSISTTLSCRV